MGASLLVLGRTFLKYFHEVVRECTMILYIVIIKKKRHSYSEYFLK